jgi:FlaA1/EpsC-like NDP-sugar epimerase
VTLGSVLSSLALLYLWRFEGYSRAVLMIDWMLCFLAIGGSRVAERLLDEWIRAAADRSVPVLLIGAGDTGERVLRYLRYEERSPQRVVGFLDDDVRKRGSRIHGIPVLGGREELDEVLAAYAVHEVLVAIGDPPGDLLQHVRRCCELRGIPWKVVTAGVMHTV